LKESDAILDAVFGRSLPYFLNHADLEASHSLRRYANRSIRS
jgi:hypothetical protein